MNIVIFLALLYIWSLNIYGNPCFKTVATTLLIIAILKWKCGIELQKPTLKDIIVASGFIAIFYIYPYLVEKDGKISSF